MKPGVVVPILLAALVAEPSALAAPEGRFDAQVFRPLAAPRDLVMVPKSELIGHLSPVAGLYWDAAFDPLALIIGGTGKALDVVGARLQITPLLGVGLFDWLELTAAIPLVAWQTSDNLRSIGTEGTVNSSPHVGDMRLQTKVALPFFTRREEVRSGFGFAVAGNINLPTGDPLAFSSDGGFSGGALLIADYRFNIGLVLASNLGVWIRPEHQFAGVRIGDMAQFGVAAEMYVVQRWGLSIIGEVYGYPSLTTFPTQTADQIPAEVLLGVRWQTRQGIAVTVGGSFGAACGFGAPAIRLFNSLTWQPKSSAEQKAIDRILERDAPDPDGDGLVEPADQCPNAPGRPERNGCPDRAPAQGGVRAGDADCASSADCESASNGPRAAWIDGDRIVTKEPIRFASDSAVPLDASLPVLEEIVVLLHENPDIRELTIEAHTDVREGDGDERDSLALSRERGLSVVRWLFDRGVPRKRLRVLPMGHRDPEFKDTKCTGPEEVMPLGCVEAVEANRRVVFRITQRGRPEPRPILGLASGSVPSLPKKALEGGGPGALLPYCRPFTKNGEPPIACILPVGKRLLPKRRVLDNAKDGKGGLPKVEQHRLPSEGVLPTQRREHLPKQR